MGFAVREDKLAPAAFFARIEPDSQPAGGLMTLDEF
jgi:hypothetical protein